MLTTRELLQREISYTVHSWFDLARKEVHRYEDADKEGKKEVLYDIDILVENFLEYLAHLSAEELHAIQETLR
jgi:uncharacterized protein YutE (UPF0331/DUF86 family)